MQVWFIKSNMVWLHHHSVIFQIKVRDKPNLLHQITYFPFRDRAFSQSAFSVRAVQFWKTIPSHISNVDTIGIVKSKLRSCCERIKCEILVKMWFLCNACCCHCILSVMYVLICLFWCWLCTVCRLYSVMCFNVAQGLQLQISILPKTGTYTKMLINVK